MGVGLRILIWALPTACLVRGVQSSIRSGAGPASKRGPLCPCRKAVPGLRVWLHWGPLENQPKEDAWTQASGSVTKWAMARGGRVGLRSDLGLSLPVGKRLWPQGSPGGLTPHPLFRQALPSQPCTLAAAAPARRGRSPEPGGSLPFTQVLF